MKPHPRTVLHEAAHVLTLRHAFGPVVTGVTFEPDDPDYTAIVSFVDPLAAEDSPPSDGFLAAVVAVAGDAAVHAFMPDEAAAAPTGTDRSRVLEGYAHAGGPPYLRTFRRFYKAAWRTAHRLLVAHATELHEIAAHLETHGAPPTEYLHPLTVAEARMREVKARVADLERMAPIVDAVSAFRRPDPRTRFDAAPGRWM